MAVERGRCLRAAPALLALALTSSTALAQAPTCGDIEFKSSAIERFPSVAQSCNSVVERNGELYVRLVAEVIRARSDSVLLYLEAPDGTKFRQEFKPPPGFRAMISGRPTPASNLRRGQEIHFYLPKSDWQLIGDE
jgi:hypothetical protein